MVGSPPQGSGGVSNHTVLSTVHTDTVDAAIVAGDVIYVNATPKWARLGVGTEGTFLKTVSGAPAWAASSAANHNILSTTHPDTLAASVTAGAILIGNATPLWAVLAAGTANYVLKMGASLPAWGQVAHSELTGVTSDQHHAQAHGSAHGVGGADPAPIKAIVGGLYGGSQAQGTTRYGGVMSGIFDATEANVEQTTPYACTFKNLYVKASVNSLSGTLIVTIRKNTGAGGADTIVTVTITAGSTAWFSDLVNSVTFAAGDAFCISAVAAGGTGSYQYLRWIAEVDAA